MNREEFDKKVAELEAKMRETAAAGESTDSIMAEMEKLKAEFQTSETASLEAANKAAVVNPAPAVPVNVIDLGGKKMDSKIMAAEDKKKMYEDVFATILRGKNIKDLTAEEQDVFRFMNTTTTAAGNVMLVPETVSNQIWDFIREAHPVVADANILHVPGEVTLPLDGTTASAAWGAESDSTSVDALTMGSLTLKGNELSKIINVSWKLKKMAVPAFLAYVTEKLADLMGTAIADAFVNGKGQPGENDDWKPQPLGAATAVENETSTPQLVTYTAANGLVYTDITNALSKIGSKYSDGIVAYANQKTVYTRLCNVKDEEGRPIFLAAPADGAVARIFGVPVKIESAVADDAVLFGNMGKGYAANVNEEVSMTVEDHVSARNTDFGGYAILDGGVLNTKAFAYVKKSS